MRDQGEGVPIAVVLGLGLTQIIGYGTLYYSFSILAPDMAKDLGWSVEQVFGLFSASLLAGGLIAPSLGRWMDRFGAATVMAVGSAVAALTLALCAWSPSVIVFTLGLVLLEVASGMVQYQAAFAALVEIRPRSAARSITYLTLIAGFASTLFWPITTGLHAVLSWREVYLVYAGLNLALCLPLHAWMMRYRATKRELDPAQVPAPVVGALAPAQRRLGFYLVAAAFALQGFTLSAVLVHMVPMLAGLGLGAAAVTIGALFGPAQVASRLVNMIFGTNLSPPALATLSAVLIVGAVVILQLSGTWLPGAVAFAVMLGLGSGINSIAQGSLPLWLFGSDGYGGLTGRMASVRLVAGAAAPFAFSMIATKSDISVSLISVSIVGSLGVVAFGAMYWQSQAFSKRLIKTGAASRHFCSIVNITSVNVEILGVNRPDYCITKTGLSMATRLFAARLAEEHIHAYEVRPGITMTEMTQPSREKYDRVIEEGLVPMRRWGDPSDIGEAVAGLATGGFKFSTGDAVFVDGGLHLYRL